jgi:hypothetical protein
MRRIERVAMGAPQVGPPSPGRVVVLLLTALVLTGVLAPNSAAQFTVAGRKVMPQETNFAGVRHATPRYGLVVQLNHRRWFRAGCRGRPAPSALARDERPDVRPRRADAHGGEESDQPERLTLPVKVMYCASCVSVVRSADSPVPPPRPGGESCR